MKTSAKSPDSNTGAKTKSREYPFLEINFGPFGKPTLRTYLSPSLNKSLTLPMNRKADRNDWNIETKRFVGERYAAENMAIDAAEKLYRETRSTISTFSDVETLNERMRDITTNVLNKATSTQPSKATRSFSHRRHGFPGLSVTRKANGSIQVAVTKFGTARCATVGTVTDAMCWNESLKRVIGDDKNRINDIMTGVEKLYTKHYANVGSAAELDALRNKIAIMAGRIANEVSFSNSEKQPAKANPAAVEPIPSADAADPTARVETITPEMAKELIRNGVRNRSLSREKIEKYAEDMRNGNWRVIGKCIDINSNGQLQEGFTRLNAVIRAGVPVKFMVARGVDPDAFTVYDCGTLRTATHVMQVTDSKNPAVVASIVKLHTILRNNGRVLTKETKRKTLTNQQVHDTYMQDQKGYEDAAVVGIKYNKQFGAFTKSWAGAMYYYLTVDCHYPRKKVTDFYDSLFTMDTGKIQQADQLRKTMTDLMAKRYRISDEARWAFFARAWNAYIAGTQLKRLRMLADGEDVPAVTPMK